MARTPRTKVAVSRNRFVYASPVYGGVTALDPSVKTALVDVWKKNCRAPNGISPVGSERVFHGKTYAEAMRKATAYARTRTRAPLRSVDEAMWPAKIANRLGWCR